MFSEFMFSKANLCNKNGPLVSNIEHVDFCMHVNMALSRSTSKNQVMRLICFLNGVSGLCLLSHKASRSVHGACFDFMNVNIRFYVLFH